MGRPTIYKNPVKGVNITITQEQLEFLENTSQMTALPKAHFVREALDQYMKNYKSVDEVQQQKN